MCWNVLEYVEISMGLLIHCFTIPPLYHDCYVIPLFFNLERWPKLAQGSLAEAMPSSLDLTVTMMTGPRNMKIYAQNKAGTRTDTCTHWLNLWLNLLEFL